MTPLVTIPSLPTGCVREAVVANAYSCVGYHGGDPATEAAFQELLGSPGRWPLRKPYGKGGISTCAMAAIGLLRRVGAFRKDYRIGSGLDDAIALAWANDAWVRPRDGKRPRPGDIVQVLGPMHALTVVEWRGDLCISVDGGQAHPRDGLQCIALVSRPWRVEPGARVCLGGRAVDGWIDVSSLPCAGPAIVPAGWET